MGQLGTKNGNLPQQSATIKNGQPIDFIATIYCHLLSVKHSRRLENRQA